MNQGQLETALVDLSLGGIRYYGQVGSTNDEAARWVLQGAPDRSLVVANEQTAGRGRAGRHWVTPADAALAFSLVLYPTPGEVTLLSRVTALGALAVCDTLRRVFALPTEIKWPNDVLVARRKVAGVLVESQWMGDCLQAFVLGIGMNVAPASVDEMVLPASALRFPVICLEEALGQPVDRLVLLHSILEALFHWHSRLSSADFMQAWEMNLAFRGEWVQVISGGGDTQDSAPVPWQQPTQVLDGQVLGLASDGSLKLLTRSGGIVTVQVGEISLRPLNDQ